MIEICFGLCYDKKYLSKNKNLNYFYMKNIFLVRQVTLVNLDTMQSSMLEFNQAFGEIALWATFLTRLGSFCENCRSRLPFSIIEEYTLRKKIFS